MISGIRQRHVHLDNVIPGGYKVFAWDDVEVTAWQDPHFIPDV
jgi:hypothetical protein